MCARYLGIDYGTKRIGLAVSDPDGQVASPLTTLLSGGDPDTQARDVVRAAEDYGVEEWVVGLPLNMDDSEGPQSKLVRRFATCLARFTDDPVHLWDERLSSLTADDRMAQTGLTHKKKKKRRDALAAHVILQSFLEAHHDNS